MTGLKDEALTKLGVTPEHLRELGITPERIVAELFKMAFPDDDIRHLVSVEVQVAALESLNRIRPEVLAACGIQSTRVVQ